MHCVCGGTWGYPNLKFGGIDTHQIETPMIFSGGKPWVSDGWFDGWFDGTGLRD
jgi:hypothetical protein